jgi:hypothetical protein
MTSLLGVKIDTWARSAEEDLPRVVPKHFGLGNYVHNQEPYMYIHSWYSHGQSGWGASETAHAVLSSRVLGSFGHKNALHT